jgi:hypothetical protein
VLLPDVANEDENADDDAIAPTPRPTPRMMTFSLLGIEASASFDENEMSSIIVMAEKTFVIAIVMEDRV